MRHAFAINYKHSISHLARCRRLSQLLRLYQRPQPPNGDLDPFFNTFFLLLQMTAASVIGTGTAGLGSVAHARDIEPE